MSSIERMSIQGIRSFGVDDKDRQVIQFFAPLTLILGPNGTGKTTIIECLKYMTTGDMPPGCTKGGAFIHDPKIAHERQVKGQIRLQFKDRAGKKVVVQRSLEATQKLKKIEVRTLEGMITRLGKDGQKHSISSRCAEIDREMITSLGVSKAILENVIFCHQEDSCWPLSEGKVLKQKFDDIFASTRYTKVLDNIRKISKDQVTEIKLIEKDLSYLRQNKEKAGQLRADLAETETRYVASKETVEKIVEKLDPIQDRLDQLGSRHHEIVKIQTRIEKLAGEKKQMEKTAQELQDSIKHEYDGTTDELRQYLEDFQDEVQGKNDKLKKYERKLESVKNEIEKISEEKSKVLLQQGKLEEESKRNEVNVRKREKLIRALAEEHNIEGYSRSIRNEEVKTFMEEMKQKAEKILEDAKTVRAKFEEKEEELQKQIDDLRSTKSKLEENEKLKTDMMVKNKAEVRHINQELSRVDASSDRLDGLDRELRRVTKDLQEAEESMNVEEMKSEVAGLQKEKVTLDAKASALSSEMSKMHMESTARAQLEMLQKDKTAREEQIRKIKSRHEDSLTHLLGHVPSDGIKRKLDDYIRQQTNTVHSARSELQSLKVDLSKKEENRKNIIEQSQRKEKELGAHEEKIFEVCGESQNFDEGITKLKEKIDQEQDKRGSYYGAKYFLEKYLRRLNEDTPPCPLCHRLFESQDEVEELISEIRDNLNLVPNKLETAEKNLNQYRTKYDKMQQMKPLRSTIKDLADREIPDLKMRQRTINEEIDGLRCLISEKEEELESQQGDETLAKQIQPDIVMLDRYQVELRDLDRKITTQASKLSGGDSKRTMQQVNKEKEEAQLNLDMLNRKLESKRQQISDHTERVHQLHSSVNELTSEKLQIENDLQQRIRLEESKAELINKNKEYEEHIREAREQIQPLKNNMEKLRVKRDEITAKKEDHYEDDKAKYDAMREKGRDVMRVHAEIEKYIRDGRGQALENAQSKIFAIEDKVTDLVTEDNEFSTNIDKIRKELAAQQVRERELSDNLQLRKKREEVGEINAQIAEQKDKLEGFDVSNLQREIRKLQTKQEDLMKEKHIAAGRQSTLEEEIRRYKRELQDNMFKNAESQYQDKMIVKRTTEMANSDLDKYYKALDRTIFQYHAQKMADINKMIRELWRNTYKGNDIETIEIRSDEDEGTSGAAKARRVYNYRVVMLKGETVIDMRGRCSAGQKVLASLIIRLALAEAFCVNCGILALDEPTTNLDRENIESLAGALVDIISSRAGQTNFQLVVITHDEDFVELLGRSDYVEEFFKVRKDQFGLSQLVKAKVQDLHSR